MLNIKQNKNDENERLLIPTETGHMENPTKNKEE